MSNNLTWKVTEIKYECEGSSGWVSISPDHGDETTTASVNVSEAISPDDCARATITISASTGDDKIYIPVTRCVPVCKCESLNFNVRNVTGISSDGQNDIELGTYNSNCSCTGGTKIESDGKVLINPRFDENTGKILGDVGKNESTSERDGWYKLYFKYEECTSGTVKQNKYVDPCTTASCRDISVSPTAVTFSSSESSTGYTITMDNCWTVTSNSDSSWISINETNKTISVEEYTSTTSDRNGTVTFTFENAAATKSCPKTISVRQKKAEPGPGPPQPTCDCDNLIVSQRSSNIPALGGNNVSIATYSVDNCTISSIRAELTQQEEYITRIDASGGNVVVDIKENTNEDSRQFGYKLYVKYQGQSDEYECYDGYYAIQAGTGACTCEVADVQVETTAITLSHMAGATAETTYSHQCSVNIVNNNSWLNVTEENSKLKFSATSQASEERTANVYIVSDGGEQCEAIKVTQEQKPCGGKLMVVYSIEFESQPVVLDELIASSGYYVGGAKVNYTKCDGTSGVIDIATEVYRTITPYLDFKKEDFNGNEYMATKVSSALTISDLSTIDSITLPNSVTIGGAVNRYLDRHFNWGGDYHNYETKEPDTPYVYECYESTCTYIKEIHARTDYSFEIDGNGDNILNIKFIFEDLIPYDV